MLRREEETVQELRKTFTKPEAEVVNFEKTDIVTMSTKDAGVGDGIDSGD